MRHFHLRSICLYLVNILACTCVTACAAGDDKAGVSYVTGQTVSGGNENAMTVIAVEGAYPVAGETDNAEAEEPIEASQADTISLSEAGIHEECISLIEDIIEKDVENGFPSVQLAIMRDGKLVYENSWGRVNSYYPDGTRKYDSPEVTSDTLYDLASITKMAVVNYAIQKLVTDGEIDLDDKVASYLGDSFYKDVTEIPYNDGESCDLSVQQEWKASLTLKDLLKHEGGFPADPHYYDPNFDMVKLESSPDSVNILYAGNGADEETKESTIRQICRTPLLYEPGTRTLYSDVDYMILGVVVEQVTGTDLDTYFKETFCRPLGLTHLTYKPLEHGFMPDDCAATELNGNTRDGAVSIDGIRTYTLQGEVHDEKAYECMGGISGHAGLFGNAVDLARLADLMLTGSYDGTQFFSQDVIDMFTAPKSESVKKWGLGWWRQGDMERARYFGSKAGESTFGHQGWTGTTIMIDPDKRIVIAYLTNKINTPLINSKADPNKFAGSSYTSAYSGFVPEIIYTGLDKDTDVTRVLEEGGWLE